MPLPTIIPHEKYKRSTWKNGLGYTDEIAIFPPESSLTKGDFLFRLSSAKIDQASAFSLFPAHDRVLAVIQGNGIRLIHTFEEGADEDSNDLPCFEIYEFPGDVPSRCELLDGPIQDFSLFIRRGEIESITEIVNIQNGEQFNWTAQGRWNFAFVLEGSPVCGNLSARSRDTIFTETADLQIGAEEGNCKLLLVSLN